MAKGILKGDFLKASFPALFLDVQHVRSYSRPGPPTPAKRARRGPDSVNSTTMSVQDNSAMEQVNFHFLPFTWKKNPFVMFVAEV